MKTIPRSEEHTSELQSRRDLVCRLLLEKKKKSLRTTCVIQEKRPETTSQVSSKTITVSRSDLCIDVSNPEPLAVQLDFPCFFFNDTATTEIYTLSLHDALPI